jgi:hypothetical protein
MHVAAERAEAVVIICLPCAHNDAVAAANVVRFDPASKGVGLERTQPISLDVGLTDLTAHFSGVEEVRERALLDSRVLLCCVEMTTDKQGGKIQLFQP